MIDFEGNMSEPSRRSKHLVAFEDEDDDVNDLDYSITSISTNDWEAKIDANLYSAFSVPPYIDKC